MPRWFAAGIVYSLIFLLCLLGTILLFLEQIFNSEVLSPTTLSVSRIGSGILWLIAVSMIIFRQPAQAVIQWLLEDTQQAATELWQHWKKQLWQDHPAHWGIFAGIIVLAILLRLCFIAQPIRTDEALTYLQFASKPVYLALSDYSAPNNHVFHTFFVHLSTRLFGNNEIALRLPTFIFGVLVIPAAYLAIRRVYHKNAGLFAAGLCAVSSVLIEYSTNARGYMLQTTLFLLALSLAISLPKNARPAGWVFLALLLAAGFYTVPTMLYGAGILMTWLLISIWIENNGGIRRKLLLYWLAAGISTVILTFLLYLPVMIVSGISAITSNIYVQALDFSQFVAQTPQAAETLIQQWHTSIHPIIAMLLGLGFLAALVFHRQIAQPRIALFGVIIMVIPPLLLLQRVHPFARIWLFLLPVYFGMAAAGLFFIITQLSKHFKNSSSHLLMLFQGGLGMLVISLGTLTILHTQSPYTSIETGTFRDAEKVTLFLAEQLKPENKIIYEHPSGESLRYYFLRHQISPEPLEWDYLPHETIYAVINTEYRQDIASVFYQNGLRLSDYTVELLQTYPLAEVYFAVLNNDD